MVLRDEKREWFLEMESASGEDCWHDHEGFRILHELGWSGNGRVGEDRLQIGKKFDGG